jgi:hypothetical protein
MLAFDLFSAKIIFSACTLHIVHSIPGITSIRPKQKKFEKSSTHTGLDYKLCDEFFMLGPLYSKV